MHLQLMIHFQNFLIKNRYLPQIFLKNIISESVFSMLHQNIVHPNKFFNFSSNFLHSFMLIWLFQEQFHFRLYLQSYKLVIFNSQINKSPYGPILEMHWYQVIFNFLPSFYMQLRSGLSPQSSLYFQGFQGSKLLNFCLVVLRSNLGL